MLCLEQTLLTGDCVLLYGALFIRRVRVTRRRVDLPNPFSLKNDMIFLDNKSQERKILMTKRAQKSKMPDVVRCPKCDRPFDPKKYIAWPDKDTPEEIITREFNPKNPYFSVRCPNCAEFTISSPLERDNPVKKL